MPTRHGGSFWKKGQYVASLDLPADNDIAICIDAMNLKDRLGDIDTNCRDRLHG